MLPERILIPPELDFAFFTGTHAQVRPQSCLPRKRRGPGPKPEPSSDRAQQTRREKKKMRIRKSPWDRCGSWRWLAWDTGFTWRPQSVGSLDVQKLSEGGDPRACRAESQKAHGPGSFHASVGIRPRTSHVNVGWQPLPLEGEGTSGLTSQRLLGQDNRGPSEVCKATHSPGRRNPQSLGWAGPTVGQGLP